MGMEGPSRKYTQAGVENFTPAEKEHWAKQEKMLQRWDTVNGPMFLEAVEDSRTVEYLISAVNVCAVRDERSPDKVMPRFSGGRAMASGDHVAGDILDSQAAYHVVNAIKNAQTAFKDEGPESRWFMQQTNSLPRELADKLKEILVNEKKEEK